MTVLRTPHHAIAAVAMLSASGSPVFGTPSARHRGNIPMPGRDWTWWFNGSPTWYVSWILWSRPDGGMEWNGPIRLAGGPSTPSDEADRTPVESRAKSAERTMFLYWLAHGA